MNTVANTEFSTLRAFTTKANVSVVLASGFRDEYGNYANHVCLSVNNDTGKVIVIVKGSERESTEQFDFRYAKALELGTLR